MATGARFPDILKVVCLNPPGSLGLADRLDSDKGEGGGEGRLLFEVQAARRPRMPAPMPRNCSLLLERMPCSFASVQIGDNALEGPNSRPLDVEREWREGGGSGSLPMRELNDVVLPKKVDCRRDGFVKPKEGVEDDCRDGLAAIIASASSESESFSSTRSESGTIMLTRRLEGTMVFTEWADSASETGRVALGSPAPGLIVT